MPNENTRSVNAVHITCEIIESLQQFGPAGVTELANKLNRSKSTIHNHLCTLEEHALIVKRGTEYRLSLRFLDIAGQVKSQFGNYEIVKRELEGLADETGDVAQFGIEEDGMVSYFYKIKGNQGVETSSRIGTQKPMSSTALGKAILSKMSDDQIHEIIDQHGLPKKTRNSITSRENLFEEIEEVRQQGYAIDDEENIQGLRCLAAPVMIDEGQYGAVSVSGPASRFTGETLEELSEKVMYSANVIELNTKYSG